MWYRGPDLKLGLVNSSFVHAVEANDASEVIDRGFELVDDEGDNSAAAAARKAQELGRIVSRMQPAIIRGERRMLRTSTFRFRQGRSPASRSMFRILRTRGPNYRGIWNCSASWRTE